ncbi:caspase family protein [Alphaproteobacteria bacterium]|nr:caspase family protein [Alphaproteobacteria bacterium]
MNYAFKMMAVVLALGVLLLQGCQTTSSKTARLIEYSDSNTLLIYACKNNDWDSKFFKHVKEAKSRGLSCRIKKSKSKITDNSSNLNSDINISINAYKSINKYSDYVICLRSKWREGYLPYQGEAKRRGLDCNIENRKKTVSISKNLNNSSTQSINDTLLCIYIKNNYFGVRKYIKEAKRRGLDCGVGDNKTVVASKTTIKKPSISSAELKAERKKRLELEKELAEIKNIQKQEQQRINTDNQKPIINAFSKLDGSNAIISGRVTDNTEVAEVLIDGEQLSLTNNGTFKTELYVPRNGLNIEIVAYDKKGNKAFKLLKIERGNIQQASGPKFDTLNPSGKRVKPNPNALALIIGVGNYEKTSANALYADKDAQQFYDYATMKLGISPSNIKELVNAKADRVEIGLAIQDWIARSTKQGKTDIYIFFAGHGLASQDGKDMFLLPYDGSPRLLKASAIRRKELFDNIQQSNPRSVTVFLDTCYSGTTRGTDMLVASRPIMIKAKEQTIPSNFTVFSAAAGDQTSKPLEEAKHGMFSYFLMKGMEGDADANNDNKITARELHAYVEQNVVQQSSGSQTPELQGDKDRVLVQFN